jgi:hypothetical protein
MSVIVFVSARSLGYASTMKIEIHILIRSKHRVGFSLCLRRQDNDKDEKLTGRGGLQLNVRCKQP